MRSAAEESTSLSDSHHTHMHTTSQRLRRRLQFSPYNNDIPHTTELSFSHSTSHVPPLPRYWIENPLSHFRMIEMIFDEHAVTSERARFTALMSALSHDELTLDAVADVLQQSDAFFKTPSPIQSGLAAVHTDP